MTARNSDVPGNTVQSQRAFEEQQLKYGIGLTLFDHICSSSWRGEVEVTGFSVRPPQSIGGEWLVVARGIDGEGTPVVAFHSALGVGEAVAGMSGRIQHGNIKWRVDGFRTSQ